MCIGYPARVAGLEPPDVIVETEGRLRRASTLLEPEVAVGDFVIVAAGTIVERLEPEEAHQIQRLLDAAIEQHHAERNQ